MFSLCYAKRVKAFGIFHNPFESGSTLRLLNVSLITRTSVGLGGCRKTVARLDLTPTRWIRLQSTPDN